MSPHEAPLIGLFDPPGALPFRQLDSVRRMLGTFLDHGGLGPQEAPSRVAAEMAGARLRAYQDENDGSGPPLLIIPAPFKRPYIWDLRPAVSVVRRCRSSNLPVYLLEWRDPVAGGLNYGLSDYAVRLPVAAITAIAEETGRNEVLLAGHSLGGTFAAICAALHPNKVAGLLLIEAPLAFAESGGPLARAVAAAPPARTILDAVGNPVPGSAVNALSGLAAPDSFYWRPIIDALASVGDVEALAIHTCVRRWTLDEFALPGRLFIEVVDWLYREDRLASGKLVLGGRRVGLARVCGPLLAVVNSSGRVVPPQSTLVGLALTNARAEILQYSAETGTLLEHVAALVGPHAHAVLWPRILDWLKTFA